MATCARWARVSKIAWPSPYAVQLFPKTTFDVRKVLAVHAHGIADAASNSLGQSTRDNAFTLSAELFLMHHTHLPLVLLHGNDRAGLARLLGPSSLYNRRFRSSSVPRP